MTVRELCRHFAYGIVFHYFNNEGEPLDNAMLDSEIKDWFLQSDFTVLVYLA